jgi:hypothetical protein
VELCELENKARTHICNDNMPFHLLSSSVQIIEDLKEVREEQRVHFL